MSMFRQRSLPSQLCFSFAVTLGLAAGSLVQGCGDKVVATTECTNGPKPVKKSSYVAGYAQVGGEGTNAFRIAETNSMKSEAANRGIELRYKDDGGLDTQQVKDVQSFIDQKVDVIFLSPHSQDVLSPAVVAAAKACIPVFLIDRAVDETVAIPGKDYVAKLIQDMVAEGAAVAQWILDNKAGPLTILELEGTSGSTPAILRKQGFDDVMAANSRATIVASVDAQFTRTTGRQIANQYLTQHPDVNVIYAHNDEMGLGAMDAITTACA